VPAAGTIAVYAGASVLIALIPGPAVLYIVTRGMDHGRRGGLASALGVNLGILVHVALAVLGLSVLLASSATAFNVVKYVGAAYLVYVGVRRLLDREEVPTADAVPVRSRRRLVSQGVIVSVFNPKLALFFVAFLPQFVDRTTDPTRQLWVLATTFVGMAIVNATLYTLFAASARRVLASPRAQRRFNLAGGSLLSAAGAWALATRR